MQTQRVIYNDSITRKFIWASVVFAIVGMLVGVIVALQLAFWPANLGEFFSFGRLRPLHTNAVIFAFVGNMIFAGVYYSTQRLTKARMASDLLGNLHFWGWQLIIISAVFTLPAGFTQAKEYAELEWPIDIAIAVVWLIFAANFFLTLKRRREKHLYVALWFYIATIVTITILHVVNSLAIPVGPLKSYSVFAGVQDALVQWWYGHNAVAFFLTTPILGIMYYYLPKAANRPIYSYRLSIIHFWSLIFIYIWAGPHHLLYTALPDWAQTLGMIFSVMLWAPSWGGMINGLLTLRGNWAELRRDPVLKFFAAGVTFYGMATFEGPLLSIKSVSSLGHYTDWIVAHVHGGALGWNGFMAAGMFYWLVPRLYGTKLRSRSMANLHFWIGTIGILLYLLSMWTAGIQQGLMWRAQNEGGGLLYPSFVETLIAIAPLYWARMIGGTLYLLGFLLMAWNLFATARTGAPVDGEIEVPVESTPEPERIPWPKIVFDKPMLVIYAVSALIASVAILNAVASAFVVAIAVAIVIASALAFRAAKKPGEPAWHGLLEGRAMIFTVFTVIAVLIGGVAEIVPSVIAAPETLRTTSNKPYSPLELEGRDVYIAEGCYNCHSQMIRPFVWETARYGDYSKPGDSAFDHPFQWGSKRTGPDLARVGGKYSHVWHYNHMLDPRSISPGSNMPPYPHLAVREVDFERTADKMRALRNVGVPYGPEAIQTAETRALAEADGIVAGLAADGVDGVDPKSKLVALIAYLQRLGKTQPGVASAGYEPPSLAKGADAREGANP
ncbi:MAG: cytochrome-c oxidase, cbb3-type subunit I [Myxococcales bacterium]|nr:cytochrome-c oxidase, cbb3-type subunit I [Myxococcales bacterium]